VLYLKIIELHMWLLFFIVLTGQDSLRWHSLQE
jgi:hypothetical protein